MKKKTNIGNRLDSHNICLSLQSRVELVGSINVKIVYRTTTATTPSLVRHVMLPFAFSLRCTTLLASVYSMLHTHDKINKLTDNDNEADFPFTERIKYRTKVETVPPPPPPTTTMANLKENPWLKFLDKVRAVCGSSRICDTDDELGRMWENGRVAIDDQIVSNCESNLLVFRYPINAEYCGCKYCLRYKKPQWMPWAAAWW